MEGGVSSGVRGLPRAWGSLKCFKSQRSRRLTSLELSKPGQIRATK